MTTEATLSWIEVDKAALEHNVATFKRLGGTRRLMIVVKANAYGHGLIDVARTAIGAGADWLAVFAFFEARELRRAGVAAPILVLGPADENDFTFAAENDIRLTVASVHMIDLIAASGVAGLKVHAKVETGTHRQGLDPDELPLLAALVDKGGIELEGVYTHYADIEDTTDHSFAESQLACFESILARARGLGLEPSLPHTACTAASILFDETYYGMIRVGIGVYGLWPSKETFVSARQLGREVVELKPVMIWKTRIAQVRRLLPGDYVGYGRTFRATREMRLGVLPVGYANGFDRGMSNNGHVLVGGKRAPLVGRVMMNMVCVDVTDIPEAEAGSLVVLLGTQGEECISADMMASWLGTINYEVVTRAEPFGPRILI